MKFSVFWALVPIVSPGLPGIPSSAQTHGEGIPHYVILLNLPNFGGGEGLLGMYQIEPHNKVDPLAHWRGCWDHLEGTAWPHCVCRRVSCGVAN